MPSFKFFSLSPYAKFRNYNKKKKKKLNKVKHKRKKSIQELKTEYQRYLESDYWRNTRQKVIDRQKHCVLCSSRSCLHVHHVKYRTRNGRSFINNEDLNNLYVLCKLCHDEWHKQHSKMRIKPWMIEKIKHAIHITKLHRAEAIKIVLTR